MRSLRTLRGDRWPRDMGITVEDHPSALLELLWVRDAWSLTVTGDFPPPLAEHPKPMDVAARATQDVAAWQAAWPELWRGALAHTAEEVDHSRFKTVMTLAPGSPERRQLLQRLYGPSWHDRFGDEGLGDGYRVWSNRHVQRQIARMHERPRDEQPERASLDTLVPAWRRGLTRVVLVPCEGDFTRTIGPHALLMTEAARDDPQRYGRALSTFAVA